MRTNVKATFQLSRTCLACLQNVTVLMSSIGPYLCRLFEARQLTALIITYTYMYHGKVRIFSLEICHIYEIFTLYLHHLFSPSSVPFSSLIFRRHCYHYQNPFHLFQQNLLWWSTASLHPNSWTKGLQGFKIFCRHEHERQCRYKIN